MVASLTQFRHSNPQERPGNFSNLLNTLISTESFFDDNLKSDPDRVLGYYISFGTIYLSTLNARLTKYQYIYGDDHYDPQIL